MIHSGTYNQARLLGDEIESAMSLLMLRLDAARNHLLEIDVHVSTIASVAGVGAFLAGVFGMNLDSGPLETVSNGMWKVGLSILALGTVVVIFSVWYIKTRGWLMNG